MSTAFIFPGQGSQTIGMGRELAGAFAEAREALQEVDEALQQKLSTLMMTGDAADLTLTRNAQPAIMAVSLAVLRVLVKQGGRDISARAAYVAGHSLGEYSALAAAEALSLADTAKLLRIRGDAMQAAVPVGQGAMAAILGLEWPQVQDVVGQARDVGLCCAANDNAAGQVVISGAAAAVEKAMVLAKAAGAKRSMLLDVSAPFHSPLMQPAAETMARALDVVAMRTPCVPLIANVTADVVTEPDVIKSLLVEQVTGTVRWRESMLKLHALGVTHLVELGAGKVLSGLAKRIHPDFTCHALHTPADIDAYLSA